MCFGFLSHFGQALNPPLPPSGLKWQGQHAVAVVSSQGAREQDLLYGSWPLLSVGSPNSWAHKRALIACLHHFSQLSVEGWGRALWEAKGPLKHASISGSASKMLLFFQGSFLKHFGLFLDALAISTFIVWSAFIFKQQVAYGLWHTAEQL